MRTVAEKRLAASLEKRLMSCQFDEGECPDCGGRLSSVEVAGRRTKPVCTTCDERKADAELRADIVKVCNRLDEQREAAKEQAERKAQDEADAKHKLGNRERFNNNFRSAR